MGFAAIFASIIVLATLYIALAHYSFSLIQKFPDQVLRYVGGGNEQLGEAQHEQQGKTSLAAFVSKTQGASGGGGKKKAALPPSAKKPTSQDSLSPK